MSGAGALLLAASRADAELEPRRPAEPNLIFVLADQWRAQAAGYSGDPNLTGRTPHLDRLASESVNFANAVSSCPVCTPYRASLITGQNVLTHGLFLNDLCLGTRAVSIARAYAGAGYDTAYIGKWHLDGHGRSAYIPRERRHGFEYWKAFECTHDYNRSHYYAGDDRTRRTWDGYDVIAQTRDAERYIRDHAGGRPFVLFLSWGPPHNPYDTAPLEYRERFEAAALDLRPNAVDSARLDLAGYYAHICAMDDCIGSLLRTVDAAGIRDDTIFVFTSDHGDMLGSHGMTRKQKPWDESIMVPFLLRYPRATGARGRRIDMPIGTPDIMPTLLGLSGVEVPDTVEGTDHSCIVRGAVEPDDNAVLISCPSPFGEWARPSGREYRGLRTRQYTYVRDLSGPWLLYDNHADPYQMRNLVGEPERSALLDRMDRALKHRLREAEDEFLPGQRYIEKWGHTVDDTGTVPHGP